MVEGSGMGAIGGQVKLHQKGVDLLVNVMDASDHLDKLSQEELRALLAEVAQVLGDLLKRDVPVVRGGTGANE
jgi:hypothetical protein